MNSVWVVHELLPEASSAKFRIVHNWGALVQPTDYHENTVIGDVYTGVEIFYPDYSPTITNCQPLTYLLAELRFIPIAVTPPCTAFIYAAPHPDAASGEIEVVDCSGNTLFATDGGTWLRWAGAIINANYNDCPCFWDPLAAEESTWGRVKALYR